MSHSCNDYIIRDNKFVRNFEEMYQNTADPWDQEKNFVMEYGPNLALCALKILIMRERLSIENVLDIGCASGYHARSLLDLPSQRYVGTDVSETIIKRAVKNNSDGRVRFECEENLISFCPERESQFDLVFCAGTLYYVAPELSSGLVLKNIDKYLTKNGIFTHVSNFRENSFTNQWLSLPVLREMLCGCFSELFYTVVEMPDGETIAIGIYKKSQS